ncbi:sulfite exporter TauE/SafE family protein [Seohaeicola zhoushanensis]|uniref:Probable membrane transporter protein n=1 Tax=Seohaeicola zhoushanensis TaxID=1569283 RepID=A0A8J3M877_9RHOB|nr:sulfite exporter TauE/SafE family protein [Seohaeicola zhoushanensis]GHF50964.1 membrane protein [Seohaeicola zhoushanensis]
MPDALAGFLALPGLGWLILAVCVAGIVRGFAGFGSAMIMMPVASVVLDPVAAVTFMIAVELLGPIPNVPAAWRAAERADVFRLAFGAMLGLPLGVTALSNMPPDLFGWVVSLTVLGLLAALMAGWRYHGRLTPGLVIAAGALGGALGGAVGLAGPPVIMLYMASLLPVAAIRANLMLFLVLIDLLMLATLAIFGLLQPGALIAGLVLSVPYMAVNWAGGRLFDPARERQFRAVAYAIIATSALLGLPVWH